MELENDRTSCDGKSIRVGDVVWTGRGQCSTVVRLEADENGTIVARLANGRELYPNVLHTGNPDRWDYLCEDMAEALEGFAARARLLVDGEVV